MAFDYSEVRAVAKELIDEFGRSVSITNQSSTPADSSAPWAAQTSTVTAVSGKAAFVSTSDLGITTDDIDDVKRTDQVALFAAADDGSNDLEDFDILVDGGVNWRIVHTEVLKPGGTRLLYMFVVRKL